MVAQEKNIILAKRVAVVHGICFGSTWFMYAAGLWYGGHKIVAGHFSPGQVFSAFFTVMTGMGAQIQPNVNAVSRVSGAAMELFKILDTEPAIDNSKDDGIVPESCEGAIQAVDINFTYQSRPDAPILKSYSVTIESGQTVALA